MNAERTVYVLLVMLLAVSILGFARVRYAVYLLPMVTYAIWALRGELALHATRHVTPFALLLVLSLMSVFEADTEGLKKIFFIFVYTSVFLMFDLRKARFDPRVLNVLFIALFVTSVFLQRGAGAFTHLLVDVAGSRSTLENTLAFPFGLFAVFFLLRRRYGWSVLNALLATLALKRIVLLGGLCVLLVWLLPRPWRERIVNPWLVTVTTMASFVLMIAFARGEFDSFFLEQMERSADAVSMGRQRLWSTALALTHFTYADFLFVGVGPGNVQSLLLEASGAERGGLLHSDVLTIGLEHGLIATAVFIFLLNWQRTFEERMMAVFLTVLFLTDNVLIYQHVMLPYLLLQTRLTDREGAREAATRERAVSVRGISGADPAPDRVLQRKR